MNATQIPPISVFLSPAKAPPPRPPRPTSTGHQAAPMVRPARQSTHAHERTLTYINRARPLAIADTNPPRGAVGTEWNAQPPAVMRGLLDDELAPMPGHRMHGPAVVASPAAAVGHASSACGTSIHILVAADASADSSMHGRVRSSPRRSAWRRSRSPRCSRRAPPSAP